jgi:hypothetical protein
MTDQERNQIEIEAWQERARIILQTAEYAQAEPSRARVYISAIKSFVVGWARLREKDLITVVGVEEGSD